LATIAALVFVAVPLVTMGSANALQEDIHFRQDVDSVTIITDDATIDISKFYPAAVIRPANDTTGYGYGFAIGCMMGYNASDVLENPLAEARYHASLANASWEIIGPTETTDAEGGTMVIFALRSTVDIAMRQASGGSGGGGSGTAGAELIEDWADIIFTFQVSTKNRNSTYPGFSEPRIDINGSTEVKFDVSIDLNKVIVADSLAMDIALTVMNADNLVPVDLDESYRFWGYQADGVSTSDPNINETNGSTPVVHRFQYRNTLEQLFAYVEDDVTRGYFSWANKLMINWSAGNSSLADTTTYYGTDGECLRLYISSPIGSQVDSITLDPSLGIFVASSGNGGGVIRVPEDGGIFGSSAMSVTIGVLIGGVIIGSGVGAMYIVQRGEEEDPADVVALDKNRYYRGGRR